CQPTGWPVSGLLRRRMSSEGAHLYSTWSPRSRVPPPVLLALYKNRRVSSSMVTTGRGPAGSSSTIWEDSFRGASGAQPARAAASARHAMGTMYFLRIVVTSSYHCLFQMPKFGPGTFNTVLLPFRLRKKYDCCVINLRKRPAQKSPRPKAEACVLRKESYAGDQPFFQFWKSL